MHSKAQTFRREHTGSGQRRPYKPAAPKPWSHQGDLAALKGKKITLCFDAERTLLGSVTGKLIDADQFTVKLDIGASTPVVYFKSAMTAFWATDNEE